MEIHQLQSRREMSRRPDSLYQVFMPLGGPLEVTSQEKLRNAKLLFVVHSPRPVPPQDGPPRQPRLGPLESRPVHWKSQSRL